MLISGQLGIANELVSVYLVGYLFLALVTGVYLWCLTLGASVTVGAVTAYDSPHFGGVVRSFIFLLLLVVAGMPPFFFFFCKLGLLFAVLSSGSCLVALGLMLCLGLGWVGYYRLYANLLVSDTIGSVIPTQSPRPVGCVSYALTLLVVGLALSGLFVFDLFLVVGFIAA